MERVVAFISSESVISKIELNSFTTHKLHVKQENERNFRIQWQFLKKSAFIRHQKKNALYCSHKQH